MFKLLSLICLFMQTLQDPSMMTDMLYYYNVTAGVVEQLDSRYINFTHITDFQLEDENSKSTFLNFTIHYDISTVGLTYTDLKLHATV
jgi:hypothetical protein